MARITSCLLLSGMPSDAKKDSFPSTTISIATPIKTGGARSNSLFRIE